MGRAPKQEWADYIPSGGINDSIAAWHADKGDRVQTCASPSTLTDCPRVVWLKRHGVPPTNVMGWGKKQRLLMGRIVENLIVQQLKEDGKLLWHWQDDYAGQSVKFGHGEGLDRLEGTPDILMRIGERVGVVDSKTARSDSYQWLPTSAPKLWEDSLWFKNKIQGTAYKMLCHWNKAWFERRRLPLPELAGIFSYAMDDGIIRREVYWEPPKADALLVMQLTRRWNEAYAAADMPECTCVKEDHVKFCPYGIKGVDKDGKETKVCVRCCDDELLSQVKED